MRLKSVSSRFDSVDGQNNLGEEHDARGDNYQNERQYSRRTLLGPVFGQNTFHVF